jgi:hypothetical protein
MCRKGTRCNHETSDEECRGTNCGATRLTSDLLIASVLFSRAVPRHLGQGCSSSAPRQEPLVLTRSTFVRSWRPQLSGPRSPEFGTNDSSAAGVEARPSEDRVATPTPVGGLLGLISGL